jgi:hypothetical protein
MNLRHAVAAVLLACAAGAQAHKASDAYLTLQVDGAVVDARIDIALRDLDRDLDLDADADDRLTWREVRGRWPDIAALARSDVRLAADGRGCVAAPAADDAPALATHSDGRYAVLRLRWRCAEPVRRLAVDYRLFARTDPTHRGIVRVERAGEPPAPGRLAVLSPGAGWHGVDLPSPAAAAPASPSPSPSPGRAPVDAAAAQPIVEALADADTGSASDAAPSSFAGFVREGIHHILVGYDHVLFLLSLLLPSVWTRSRSIDPATGAARTRWAPSPALRPVLANVLKVVTAFTVAHSITLALAVLGVVDPPSRWVESLIAASVVLAALNNLWPVISEARWKLTFVFGLVHGFGFASALKDAGLAHGALAAPLVGFNVGVEIGQLCIVALVLPLAWSLRSTRAYRGTFAAGSLAIAAVAGVWLVQRAFDLSLIAG